MRTSPFHPFLHTVGPSQFKAFPVISLEAIIAGRLHNRAANLSLTATCVAAVMLRVFQILFTHVSAFCTHNATLFHFSGSRCRSNTSVPRVSSVYSFTKIRMVSRISLLTEYEEQLRRMLYMPVFSCGRQMLRDDGGPNRFFVRLTRIVQSITALNLLILSTGPTPTP